ncbi:class I SAM-dependent methyltransferase [Ruegeria sp. Ofav3-42]|uniref:class I SAM-dependent methyltransferase n=1 Tax=Ruegeria sp. Ofav3-42 TaxID=2917759 RepID=UPI001EF64F4F|nr:class I SAM-dependent methyltransferase [Ruegeria sp. Ofav3-42]MCG7520506.1 class I SAM-dependent methyltransferase [Ruegeria sp. Ofav3-42]
MKFLGQAASMPSYVPTSAWLRHGHFASWLVKAMRPSTIVELGSHFGFSYFSFCQAVKENELQTRCFAVDTWQGDEHAGFYDNDVFETVEAENAKYGNFSTLLRKTFTDALDDIPDGSVDLLHIDGRHRYSDVKEDFESWIPKLSQNAIVLFHDTEVRRGDFGVIEYWAELETQYTTINFPFQHGLGVLFFGRDATPEISEFRQLASSEAGRDAIYALFYAQSNDLSWSEKLGKNDLSWSEKLGKLESQNAASSQIINELRADFAEKVKTVTNEYSKDLNSAWDVTARIANGSHELREEIAKARSRPSKLMKDRLRYSILKKLARSRLPLSEKTRRRIRKSIAKRDPKRSLNGELAALETHIIHNRHAFVQLEGRLKMSAVYSAALDAILTERRLGFRGSLEKFAKLSQEIETAGQSFDQSMLPRFLANTSSTSQQGPIVRPQNFVGSTKIPDGLVIYTSLFGDYDQLPPVCTEHNGIEFVCFTDQDISAPGWTIERREPSHTSSNLAAKYFKLMPHEVFPDREYSLFVDANTLFKGRLDSFVAKWLQAHDFVMWRHPSRDDIVDEAETIILMNEDDPEIVSHQMAKYEAEGFPRNAGLYECSFIWRKHHNPEIKDLMEAWWQEVTTQSCREQISFYQLVHKKGPKPLALPNSLGDSRNNVLFTKLPHQPRVQRKLTKPKQQPKVAFLFDEESRSFGSAFMRSNQLASLLKEQLQDTAAVSCTTDLTSVEDSFVVVGKRLMDRISDSQIHDLRMRNVAIAADPVDAVVSPEKASHYDMIIAASLNGLESIRATSSSTPSYLLTHHADLRIDVAAAPEDKLRVGYFGELVNTVGSETLGHLVDYNLITTNKLEDSWLTKLGNYNAHFAVRNVRKIDGFKPFTKGFVAAKCGAVILCERDVGDNRFYLGDDYPYYVPSTELDEIERFLFELNDDYGSASWKYAQEIMESVRRRSSAEWIVQEFRAILSEAWG